MHEKRGPSLSKECKKMVPVLQATCRSNLHNVIIPPDPLLSHILTDESADAETMTVFISALLLDTCIVTTATELTAPSWPSRIAHIFHYEKHKYMYMCILFLVVFCTCHKTVKGSDDDIDHVGVYV